MARRPGSRAAAGRFAVLAGLLAAAGVGWWRGRWWRDRLLWSGTAWPGERRLPCGGPVLRGRRVGGPVVRRRGRRGGGRWERRRA
ncbi:hypothetical protein AB0C07_25805 [Actinoplanes missouriensis]|uniref:hypothetical protein n=1 Tax=Actinoplanes missouriensis TaxID=1866 RepID=UPI0033C29060